METTELLRELGLTEYENKIYLALAQLSVGKVSAIAKISGVPPNKVYENLKELTRKGFVSELNLVPKQYQLTGTEKFEIILEAREQKNKELKNNLNLLNKIISKDKLIPQSQAMVFQGKDKIFQMLDQTTPQLEKHAYSFIGDCTYSPRSARLIAERIKNGVDYRFLAHYNSSRTKEHQLWRKIGVKLRFSQHKEYEGMRFTTCDDKLCRLTIGRPQIQNYDDYMTFWIESPAFARILKDLFLKLWNESKEF